MKPLLLLLGCASALAFQPGASQIRTVTITVLQLTDLRHPEQAVAVAHISLPQYPDSTNVFYRLRIQ